MVIKVREFRGLDIDLSQVELGDVLEVQMQHCGPILLLLAQEPNSCSRHWIYAARHMLQGDTEQRDAIVNANWYQTSWNGHQRVSREHLGLHRPAHLVGPAIGLPSRSILGKRHQGASQ